MLPKRNRLSGEQLEERRVLSGIAWFENTGQPLGETSFDIPLADLDGDGDLDAFVACYNGWPAPSPGCEENVVWLNDGQGNFSQSWHAQTGPVSAAALGDLDGDGDLDAFLGKGDVAAGRLPDEVWLNDGQGNFEDTGQRLGLGASWDVALGDVDSDGDLDAFVANGSYLNGPVPANRGYVWLNDGHGNFTDSGQELGRGDGSAIALGDLDGDGDLDAFLAQGYQDGRDAVFTNDGQGNFTNTGQSLGSGWANAVKLGDLDGDGDLDAFVANGDQFGIRQPNDVWLNDGSGTFIRSVQQWVNSESRCVALADIDGDGDLDAYVGNREPDKLWLNDGSGHFTDSGQDLSSGPNTSGAVSLGDTDSDGDLDAIVGKLGGPNEIWRNLGLPPGLPGDANLDGRVDAQDLNIIALNWRGTEKTWAEGDFTRDGNVDAADLNALALNWQSGVTAQALAAKRTGEDLGLARLPRAPLAVADRLIAAPVQQVEPIDATRAPTIGELRFGPRKQQPQRLPLII